MKKKTLWRLNLLEVQDEIFTVSFWGYASMIPVTTYNRRIIISVEQTSNTKGAAKSNIEQRQRETARDKDYEIYLREIAKDINMETNDQEQRFG